MANVGVVYHVGAGEGVAGCFQQIGVTAQDGKHDAGMPQAIKRSGFSLRTLAHGQAVKHRGKLPK